MSSPRVQTSYADGSGNTVRPRSRTYPNGRVVSVDYGTAGGVNDLIGRAAALVDDDDTPLAEYQYLGLGAVVQQDSPEADLRSTLVNPAGTNDPDTGDIYSGLDRFGRVKDVRWRDVSAGSDLSRVQYGYDRASNRTFRRNPSDPANQHDWLYGYDGLHRLQDAERGTLNGGHTGITSPQFAQCWTLDPTGNWAGFRQADSGDPWDLVQARLANPVNEITGIANSTGPAWAQPAYDGAGNMTTIPQPADPTESYTATYDAWNRLVKLVDPATGHTVQENEYDGRGYRTVRKSYTAGVLTETRHFYYTDGWRDVEERLGTSPDTAAPDRQFVWGVRYIDDLVLRDRSNAGPLDERLYALQDANWNVTAVVDDAGAVQERYEYDPYGQLTVLSPGFVVRAASSFGWETIYAGYRFEDATHLSIVRHRSFHVSLGVWPKRDPLRYVNSTTLYEYSANAPLDRVDPFGLDWYSEVIQSHLRGIRERMRGPNPQPYRHIPEHSMDYDLHNWVGIPSDILHYAHSGCRGVVGSFLGTTPHTSSARENCYTTLNLAREEQARMIASDDCCNAGQTNVWGQPAQPAIVAMTFNADPANTSGGQPPWYVDDLGRVRLQFEPTSYDYQYYDPDNQVWWGGDSFAGPNNRIIHDARIIPPEFMPSYNASLPLASADSHIACNPGSTVRVTVYCVMCQQNGDAFRSPPQNYVPWYSDYWRRFMNAYSP